LYIIGKNIVIDKRSIVEFFIQFNQYNMSLTMPYLNEAKKFETKKEAEDFLEKLPNDFKVIEM